MQQMRQAQEAVISAAVLTATAFRMRNEGDLVTALQVLTNTVANLEAVNDNAPATDFLPEYDPTVDAAAFAGGATCR